MFFKFKLEKSKKYTKDKPPHYGHHSPYAAVCLFRRPGGRPDNGNHLESGEIRGNMLTRWFGFVPPCRASAPLMRRTVEYF